MLIPSIQPNQRRKKDGATALYERIQNERALPLFIASFFGHLGIVSLLLQHSVEMAQQHIDYGVVDVNRCDSKGFTPLFVAAQNGHAEVVKKLLEHGVFEQRGHTALWIASLRGHLDVVRVLLAHPNVDIDSKDKSGVTPLWAACQNNNVDVVELLLHPRDVEAKIETQGHQKRLTLTSSEALLEKLYFGGAPKRKKEDDDPMKKKHGSSTPTPKFGGIRHAHQRTSSRLLWEKKGQRKGADPNLAKLDGCTPLWIAASRGNFGCIKHLIHYGADLNKPDRSQGATPLFVAAQNGNKEAVDLLLAAKADVNQSRNGDGTTPLMMAAHNGHTDVVDIMLRSGADPIRVNRLGLNALGCAAMQGHEIIVRLCYRHLRQVKSWESIHKFMHSGDSVNGWTPFHLACMGGHIQVIKFLIEEVGVDIFQKDNANKTGLDHAWQNDSKLAFIFLKKKKRKTKTAIEKSRSDFFVDASFIVYKHKKKENSFFDIFFFLQFIGKFVFLCLFQLWLLC
ncbi:hypothetical protein RFI_06610 [Reticulomyxa filosa]|uniref:Uncharacterized protein n=1 Tax=Reticulomyxa filosa TaxID=46433 RepID=X6NX93_RETFI|nr:hypothetical protein RFI_06610 [Reticulomyxa filosa]|eukprot:ETO30508.1 hypothetical protein RFI_06610 [Reticulomyxa filosa]